MKPASELTRLFVYGSLKRGFANHHVLEGAQFVGECRTTSHYRLFDLGDYPALSLGGERPIAGELYLVPEADLHGLDRFEGDEYLRTEVALSDGKRAQAYLLADFAPADAREINCERWSP